VKQTINNFYQSSNQIETPSRRTFIKQTTALLALAIINQPFDTRAENSNQKIIAQQIIQNNPKINTQEEYDAYFYTVSTMSGLGIAIDVAIATIAMFRHLDSKQKQTLWTGGVGLSHILLPVLSGSLTAGIEQASEGSNHSDIVNRALSAGGFGLIIKFLYEEINGDDENKHTEKDILNAQNLSKYLAAIWAVSVDAAVSGPAKYKQASNQNWSLEKTLKSVTIGGLTVSLVAFSALQLANKLREKYTENSNVEEFLEKNDSTIMAIEAFILNYFGVDALLNGTFKTDTGFWGVSAASLFATGALYLPKITS
jgi:hypothetical protein